jgi:hypothetical protein
MHGVNLGTLLRTCDAVGACLAVPRLPWVPEALARGNTLRRPACVHWTGRDACRFMRDTFGCRMVVGGVRRPPVRSVAEQQQVVPTAFTQCRRRCMGLELRFLGLRCYCGGNRYDSPWKMNARNVPWRINPWHTRRIGRVCHDGTSLMRMYRDCTGVPISPVKPCRFCSPTPE